MSSELIDWHTHVWTPSHLGAEWGPELDAKSSTGSVPPSAAGSPEDHDHALESAGARTAIVIGLVSDHLGMEIPNDFIVEVINRSQRRLIGFGSVDPNRATAVEELHRTAQLGLRGLKLSPPYQAFHPHSGAAYRIYQAANDLGLVVMFHQGGVFSRRGVLEYANPALLDKVARDFPQLRIIVAHVGQPWFFETVALLYKHPNVYADLSARFARPWQLFNIMMQASDYGVTGKLLFGSDFPAFAPEQCVKQFRDLGQFLGPGGARISEAVIDSILYERPLSLLGLDT